MSIAELHDYMGEERGRSMGMPLNDFIDQLYPQLERSEERASVGIPLGVTSDEYQNFIATREKLFEGLAKVILPGIEL